MTTQQKISAILGQENYKVSDGKVLRYDQLDDKFKPVIVSGNRIPLVKTGQIVEIFAWDDVKSVIDGMGGAAWTLDGRELSEKIIGTVDVPDFPIHVKDKLDVIVKINKAKNVKEVKKVINKTKKQIMAKKKKAETKTKSNRKPSVALTDEHIAIIKKEHNKGTSKMAIARLLSEKTGMDVTRFIVMYHVKKIDAKKK